MDKKLAVAMFGQKRLSREGGVEIVVKELCTRMARDGYEVTCFNRGGHHVSGAEYDQAVEYKGVRQKTVPTIDAKGHPALSTAYMNDCEPLLCFAQQVNGYGKAGDVFLGISTSGNSKNVLYAATTAHAKGMKVIGLTGAKSSKLELMSDVCIKVPQTETYMIQELHLPVYHCLCLMLEDKFFGEC